MVPLPLLFDPHTPPGSLPATPPPTPESDEHDDLPPTPRRERCHHPASVTCGSCGSEITTTRGEVLKMGSRAKGGRDAESTIETLTAELDAARREIADLKARLQPASTETKSVGLLDW